MKAHETKRTPLTDEEKAAIVSEMKELRKQGKAIDEIAEIVGKRLGFKGSFLINFVKQFKEEK